jgi:hypothetical protein
VTCLGSLAEVLLFCDGADISELLEGRHHSVRMLIEKNDQHIKKIDWI